VTWRNLPLPNRYATITPGGMAGGVAFIPAVPGLAPGAFMQPIAGVVLARAVATDWRAALQRRIVIGYKARRVDPQGQGTGGISSSWAMR
jgi:hypothetical protein